MYDVLRVGRDGVGTQPARQDWTGAPHFGPPKSGVTVRCPAPCKSLSKTDPSGRGGTGRGLGQGKKMDLFFSLTIFESRRFRLVGGVETVRGVLRHGSLDDGRRDTFRRRVPDVDGASEL